MDIVEPEDMPAGCRFVMTDILRGVDAAMIRRGRYDFIVASSPCEEFSKHGLRCFYSNPPYPEMGIKLFNWTWVSCMNSCIPFVMENVRAAQKFVGPAVRHCGPFYLWGTAVPPLLNQGILKGRRLKCGGYKGQTGIQNDKKAGAQVATIPPELANCVADYAERLLQQKQAEVLHF